MYVVEQIPAGVVRVLVNDEVISAVPAPVCAEGPIRCGNIKIEASRKPEPVKLGVNPIDLVAKRRPEMRKAAMRKRLIQVEPCIVRWMVAEPLIVVDVRHVVHMAGGQMLHLGLLAKIASRRRSLRYASLVRAWWIMSLLTTPFRHAGLGRQENSR